MQSRAVLQLPSQHRVCGVPPHQFSLEGGYIWCKHMIAPERLRGAENKEANGKLRPAKVEKRICCYSKHMHLVKGWVTGILRIFLMQTRPLFKGSSENSDRLNCTVLNRPGQSFLKFVCPDRKREIMFKQAKIKSSFSR